jgi:hypothetical protein
MRWSRIAVFAATVALSVAVAAGSADARRAGVKRAGAVKWTLGVLNAGGGYYYGPRYGNPTYPSYWYGPTTGVYAVDPSLCYAPRAYPSFGGQWWDWQLENVC